MLKKLRTPVVIIVGLFTLGYLAFFGFSFPPCADREIIHPIPPRLQNATIRYEADNLAFWRYSPEFGRKCSRVARKTAGRTSIINNNSLLTNIKLDYEYGGKVAPQYRYIPPTEVFKLRYITTTSCSTLLCIDSGGKFLNLIIEDADGNLWRAGYVNDDVSSIRDGMVYYVNGKRIGPLGLEEFFSEKDGLSIFDYPPKN